MEMSAQIEVSAMMDSMVTELVRVWNISVELLVRLENVHRRAPRRQVRVRSENFYPLSCFNLRQKNITRMAHPYHKKEKFNVRIQTRL